MYTVCCSAVQAGGSPTRAIEEIAGVDSCEVDHGAHPQQRVLPGVPAAAVGAVLDGVELILLCAAYLCASVVFDRGGCSYSKNVQIQGQEWCSCRQRQARIEKVQHFWRNGSRAMSTAVQWRSLRLVIDAWRQFLFM